MPINEILLFGSSNHQTNNYIRYSSWYIYYLTTTCFLFLRIQETFYKLYLSVGDAGVWEIGMPEIINHASTHSCGFRENYSAGIGYKCLYLTSVVIEQQKTVNGNSQLVLSVGIQYGIGEKTHTLRKYRDLITSRNQSKLCTTHLKCIHGSVSHLLLTDMPTQSWRCIVFVFFECLSA